MTIERAPVLASIWIWLIIKMELLDAVTSLLAVGGFVRYNKLSLYTL
jgi:hypothetical protein